MTDLPEFRLTLLTRDPNWAVAGVAAGVDYIGVDVERIGKAVRQSTIVNARINDHQLTDLSALRHAAPQAKLFARLNPLRAESAAEISRALSLGAKVLTLPQFTRATEITEFLQLVEGRARVIPLLEDAAALEDLDAVLEACRGGELMVGLNDLARSLGMDHPLQLANSKVLAQIADTANNRGVPWGFGGVADPTPRPDLPVQPDDLLACYADLGASAAWISRSMMQKSTPTEFPKHVADIRRRILFWHAADPELRAQARVRLNTQINQISGRG